MRFENSNFNIYNQLNMSTKAALALKKQADEQMLNASIRERVAIRVGFPRLFAILLPSSLVVFWQTIGNHNF
jgi:hypothetical protein